MSSQVNLPYRLVRHELGYWYKLQREIVFLWIIPVWFDVRVFSSKAAAINWLNDRAKELDFAENWGKWKVVDA